MKKVKVYVPRAVAFLNATHEGGGGLCASPSYALRMGARNMLPMWCSHVRRANKEKAFRKEVIHTSLVAIH